MRLPALLLALLTAACTLSRAADEPTPELPPPTPIPAVTLDVSPTPIEVEILLTPLASITPRLGATGVGITTGGSGTTGTTGTIGSPPITVGTPAPTLLPGLVPAGAAGTGLTGQTCDVFTTYAGERADNVLSMRDQPLSSGVQIVRVPNFTDVYLVPGTQEVTGDGFRWLNMIYLAPGGARYEGWIARDSFQTNGVRDPSIATLRPTGRQAPC